MKAILPCLLTLLFFAFSANDLFAQTTCFSCPTSGPVLVTNTNTGNGNVGTFEWALCCVNNGLSQPIIQFDIPGGGPHVIPGNNYEVRTNGTQITPAPTETDEIIIDAGSQNFGHCLDLRGVSGVTVSDITVRNAPSAGIQIWIGNGCSVNNVLAHDNNVGFLVISSNNTTFDGIDAGGASGNSTDGVLFDFGSSPKSGSKGAIGPATITNSTLQNNGGFGIHLRPSSDEVNVSGNSFICNNSGGIANTPGPSNPLITNALPSTISGTAPTGSGTIQIYLNNNSNCTSAPCQGSSLIGTTSSSSGAWSFVPSPPLAIGTQITATYTSNSNSSPFSTCAFVQPPPCTVDATSTDVTCFDFENGTATATPTSGTPPFNFSWSNGATTQSISGLGPGTYIVTMSNSGGCFDSDTVFITQPSILNPFVYTALPPCYNQANGVLCIDDNGGTFPYTYSWSSGGTGVCESSLPDGEYYVTVTDANMCSVIDTVTLTQLPQVILGMDSTDVSCNGFMDGTATVLLSGSPTSYSINWSNGGTTQSITGLGPGDYYVTVSAPGDPPCTYLDTVTVNEPDPLFAIPTTTDPTCFGYNDGSVTVGVSGGIPPYIISYFDINGVPVNPNMLAAGTYIIDVFDVNYCSFQTTFIINQGPLLTFTTDSTDVLCNGDANGTATIIPTSGSAPYSFLWFNDVTTQTITGLSGGTYGFTVTDSGGCFNTGTVTINEPPALFAYPFITDPSCFGLDDGDIFMDVFGGVPPYNFVWSNMGSGQNLTGLTSGLYSVTVTDFNNCVYIEEDIFVGEPDEITTTIISSDVTCFDFEDGTATAFPSSGFNPYNYDWSNGASGQTVTNLGPGTYEVTVTDQAFCMDTASIQITEPTALELDDLEEIDATCYAFDDGEAVVTIAGGTPPLIYSWSNGTQGQTNQGLFAGTYTYTVVDSNQCEIFGDAIIEEPDEIIVQISATDVSCNGAMDGTATANVSGGIQPLFYVWDDNQTTQTASNLPQGIFGVVVFDDNDCDGSDAIVINEPDSINLVASATDETSAGANDGTATANAIGGVPPFSYAWSNGDSAVTINNLAPGPYTVVCTDSTGCTKQQTVFVQGFNCDFAIYQVFPTDPTCFGSNDGSASVEYFNATPPVTFIWSNGDTAQVLSGVGGGTFSVTATDATNCSDSMTVVLTEPTQILANLTGTNQTANGVNDGTAQISPTGGTPPYGQIWSTGATTDSIGGLAPGTYSVTVFDSFQCIDSASIVIQSVNCSLRIDTLISQNITCSGFEDGQCVPTVIGGTGTVTYQWSSGAITPNLINVPAGNYLLVVNDSLNCVDSAMTTLTEPLPLNITTNATNETGNGAMDGTATSMVSGGTLPYSYLWSNGDTTAMIGNLSAGTYGVTCTDGNGCMIDDPQVLVNGFNCAFDSITTSVENPLCFGELTGRAEAVPFNGNPPFNYNWASGQTTSVITGIGAGTYFVTITDSTNCADTAIVILTQPDSFFVDITTTAETDNGANNGSATAVAGGGVPTYQYQWSNGETTATITNLMPGTYSLTCTDENGCQLIFNNIEVEPSACSLVIDSLSGNDLLCFNDADGEVNSVISGAIGSVNYFWSNGATTQNLSGVPAGQYTLIVIDSIGCTDTMRTLISQPPLLVSNLTSINESAFGANDGSASINPTGGTPPYQVQWTTGTNGFTIDNLAPGSYSVQIRDANGCTITEDFLIQRFGCLLELKDVFINEVRCFGESNGSITPVLTNANYPVQFNWSNGSTDSILANVPAGQYILDVTDASNCGIRDTFIVLEPDPLQANLEGMDESTFNANDGIGWVNPTGGTSPYSVTWSIGSSRDTIRNLSAGMYVVEIGDVRECRIFDTLIINPFSCNLDIISVQVEDVNCFGFEDGRVTPVVTGATGPISFLWSNGSTAPILENVGPGIYQFTAIDSIGCSTQSDSIFIDEPPPLQLNLTKTDQILANTADGSAQAVVSGGTMPYSYAWSNGSTDPDIDNLLPGDYSVVVTDLNLCQIRDTITIDGINCFLAIDSLIVTPVSCAGDANGQIAPLIAGGIGTLDFDWSNNTSDLIAMNLTSGQYIVVITDEVNCVATDTTFISEPDELVITDFNSVDVTCFGAADGSITPQIDGGTLPYSFGWNNSSVDSLQTNLGIGTYTMLVVDANGCGVGDTTTISQPDSLIISLSGNDVTGPGVMDGSIDGTTTGGTQPYDWLWQTGQTDEDLDDVDGGTYQVIVTDLNGCIDSAQIEIIEPDTCTTYAGEMSNTAIQTLCDVFDVVAAPTSNEFLDGNDVLEYVLHDSPKDSLGTIFFKSTTPEFTFGGDMRFGTTYYISAIAGNDNGSGEVDLGDSCLSVAIGQPVVFLGKPNPVYGFQGPAEVCGNTKFFLRASDPDVSDDIQYQWHLPTGDTIITDNPEITITPGSTQFTGDYFVLRDSLGCLSDISSPIFIEILTLDVDIINAGKDTVLCGITSFDIEATSSSNLDGRWVALNNSSIISPNSLSTKVTNLLPGNNRFVWEIDLDGCRAAAADTVNVILEQEPISQNDFYVLDRVSDVLELDFLRNDELSGVADTAVTILTQPDFGVLEYDENIGQYVFYLTEERRGQVEFNYEVCNTKAMCFAPCSEATVVIDVIAMPVLPGGLTLDGNGQNDFLFIKGLKGFDRVDVKIANRWGDIIFEEANYSNDDPWYGTVGRSSNQLPQGAYYYVVTPYEGNEQIGKTIKGVIHIFY